ncbi:hypothetical protein BD626DRAFT_550638 [Schizophyllum amplum]|uniref:Uncharacterized protein n=1 Tax=Schizophyllum amplum TaxID=97359 RepID=A0A550C1G0_9AGAR|nr:hypothetical protein BD626DRAFT_550638 [Auriculariopsis ampla]
MSAASPTLLPRESKFPLLLPHLHQPYIKPLPRKVLQEMNDLEDEEVELDATMKNIRTRGFNFLVPIGRNLTQQEEKNDEDEGDDDDVDDDDESEEDEASQPSTHHTEASIESDEEEEDDEEEDLDASMEDRDEDDEDEDEEDEED